MVSRGTAFEEHRFESKNSLAKIASQIQEHREIERDMANRNATQDLDAIEKLKRI